MISRVMVVALIVTVSAEAEPEFLVYRVDRQVKQFRNHADYSTPEAAYASIERLLAQGDGEVWRRASVSRLARLYPESTSRIHGRKEPRWLETTVLEVRRFDGRLAAVFGAMTESGPYRYHYRLLELEEGRWLHAGQSVFNDLDDGRERFSIRCTKLLDAPARPVVGDPDAALASFTEYLRVHGEAPRPFLLDALRHHRLVILGEIHHRPRYWSFNTNLVRDPAFVGEVGTIYLELPAHAQQTMDSFLASPNCDRELVVSVLRDMMWMGWPDQSLMDFLLAVWEVNQGVPEEKRLRVVLVDMERPWNQVKERADLKRVDRDRFMADTLLRDLDHQTDGRHALFIVGLAHAAKGLTYLGGVPIRTAGWHPDQVLHEELFTVTQHGCRITNEGRVEGRVVWGLFDSAFAAMGEKPVAFSLERGPFGEQVYDTTADRNVRCAYRDGFNGYLYLGPLETEMFSSLIDNFYTQDHMAEVRRRYRLLFGKKLVGNPPYGRIPLSAEAFIARMEEHWGQSRDWNAALGPMDAWKGPAGKTQGSVNNKFRAFSRGM